MKTSRKPVKGEIAALIRGVDLFCGAGGLTHGLESAGIDIELGIDIDPACEYPYTENNNASFLLKSVQDIIATDLAEVFEEAPFRLLAGCAPCQPFSTYSRGWSSESDERWHLLEHFSRLVEETQPDLVTMENVPLLEREEVFLDFVSTLEGEGYKVSHSVVRCADYGVPQQRRRLVLLASKLGSINMIAPTIPQGRYVTVERAIGRMPSLKAGEVYTSDPLHQACELSPLNIERIRASKPGGTWSDWNEDLVAKCHNKDTGKTYASVYGRMSWNKPSPTVTTQFYGFGNGRFGHPTQDRAISLREGAILQSFPKHYQFVQEDQTVHKRSLGRLIGNAVPVKLGHAIGISIVRHVDAWLNSCEQTA